MPGSGSCWRCHGSACTETIGSKLSVHAAYYGRKIAQLQFYVGGILLVFVLGRLGVWLTFHTLLWISGMYIYSMHPQSIYFMSSTAVAILLALPAALCKGWISKQTLDRVRETTSSTATAVHTYVFSHT